MHSVSRLVVVALVSLVAACGTGDPAETYEKSLYTPQVDDAGNPACVLDLELETRDCAQACEYVTCCDPDVTFEDCLLRCEGTHIYPLGSAPKPCLAQRIFWRDEEGCETIHSIWTNYDPEDRCMDNRVY